MVNNIQNSLRDYYSQEVISSIERMDTSLSKLEQEPGKGDHLRQIKDSAQSIADLAMIHGYEGVEAIAEKIISTTDSLLCTEADLDNSYSSKVKVAVNALRQVFHMEEDIEGLMSVDTFDAQIEIGQKKVQAYTERLSKSFNHLFKNQLELPFEETNVSVIDAKNIEVSTNIKEDDTEFDIRELDDLLNLDDDEQDENMEENVTELGDYPKNVRQLFNSLKQAVYELQIVPFAAKAVHDIREVCNTLYTLAQQLNDTNLKIIAEPLQRLTHEKLQETEPVSESILELLNKSIEIFNNHLVLNQGDENETQALVREINQVLKVESMGLRDGDSASSKFETELVNGIEEKRAATGKLGRVFKRLIKRSAEKTTE